MTTVRADTSPSPSGGRVLGVASADEVDTVNSGVMAEAAEAEAVRIIGTTAAFGAKKDAERQKATEAKNAARAAQVAAGGGETVTSALRGSIGELVADELRLDLIDAAAQRVENLLRDEAAELEAQRTIEARDAKLSGFVDAAFEAAQSKRGSAPGVLAPFVQWWDHDKPQGGVAPMAEAARVLVRTKRATERHQRIADRLEAVDEIIRDFATGVLERARAAHEVLAAAGLSADSTADEVIAAIDIDAQKSWYSWREAAAEWSDVQSARRWVAAELQGRGPVQAKGAYALTADPGVDAAASVWRAQFIGADLPTWVEGSHQALHWWCSEGSTYTARGVLSDHDHSDDESEVDA